MLPPTRPIPSDRAEAKQCFVSDKKFFLSFPNTSLFPTDRTSCFGWLSQSHWLALMDCTKGPSSNEPGLRDRSSSCTGTARCTIMPMAASMFVRGFPGDLHRPLLPAFICVPDFSSSYSAHLAISAPLSPPSWGMPSIGPRRQEKQHTRSASRVELNSAQPCRCLGYPYCSIPHQIDTSSISSTNPG